MRSWHDRPYPGGPLTIKRLVHWLLGFGRFVIAWLMGGCCYMMVMVTTVYDGPVSLIFQPFIAALFSFMVLLLVVVASLLFWIPPLRRAWGRTAKWAVAVLLTGLALVIVATVTFPFVNALPDPSEQETFVMIVALAWIGGTFLLMFSIVNSPIEWLQQTTRRFISRPKKLAKPLFDEI